MADTQSSPLIAAGRRDKYVLLVPQIDTTGPSGLPIQEDGDPIGLWASKLDVGGRERFASDQLSSPYDTRWVIPYLAAADPDRVDVTKAFALEHKGRRYDIVAGTTLGRDTQIELMTLARRG